VAEERAPDDGFTLVELLVAVIVGGIVLAILGGFLVSSLQADRELRGLNAATSRGELALDAMRTTLQSAAAPMGIAPGAAAGDLVLRARVAGMSEGPLRWDCVAVYYDALAGELRMRRNVGDPSAPAGTVATPDAAQLATWPVLADGVLPPLEGEVFAFRGGGSGADPSRIEIAFRIDAGGLGAPEFATSIVARSEQSGGVACVP